MNEKLKMENGKLKKYKLGEIGNVCMCKRILKEETNTASGIPFYKIGTFGNKADVYITKEKFEEYKNKFSYPKKGDILISAAGTIGRTVIYDGSDSYFQDSNIVWIDNDETKVLNKYLFYCYKNIHWFTSKGSTILRLYNDNIRNTEIVVPPLESQQKIAAVLSALDDKIALNRRMNEKLTAMAKRLYDHWFVQFDFPDADGKPYKASGGKMVWNETLKREIPAGWEVKRLGEFLDCNKNSMSSESDYKYINYLDTSSLTENLINGIAKIHQDYPSRAKRIVNKNDILFSTVRPAQHHFGIIKKTVKNMIASTGFAILSCKYGSEYNEFFYQFITSTENIEKLDSIANLNASSYPSINSSDILDLKITLPHEISELKPFIDKVSAIFELVDSRQRETQKLTALRDRLLPLLMNGQVEVR